MKHLTDLGLLMLGMDYDKPDLSPWTELASPIEFQLVAAVICSHAMTAWGVGSQTQY